VASDPTFLERVRDIVRDEGLHFTIAISQDEAAQLRSQTMPPLIIIDEASAGGGTDLWDRSAPRTPTLVVSDRAELEVPSNVEQISPAFTQEYLRSRIRTWLMRGKFGAVPACIPEDEAERLAILRSVQLLDTPPEERFDRFTRLAARVFDVPISLLTFVDEDRQWFKSRVGLPLPETSRNTSFCAHAILEDSPLVVPDALQDERFAMNPLVTGDPRIRFYAGVPLKISGQAVGTLCLVDTRPRSLSKGELDSLQDFGSLLEKELQS
jgi:hypothetical protein